MYSISLKDSCLEGRLFPGLYESMAYMYAIDKINEQVEMGKISVINLLPYTKKQEIEPFLWYQPNYDAISGQISEISIFTSHYIGRCTVGNVNLTISPRFGNVFSYLIGYAANVYLPIATSGIELKSSNPFWLITMLWKAMLEKALAQGNIPKEYVNVQRNIKHYRGHLSLHQHIHTNLCDSTHFYCAYRELSFNSTINRTIRYTYRILRSKGGVDGILSDLHGYDQRLASFGVTDEEVQLEEINHIRYTRLNEPYKPLMQLCYSIIANENAESSSKGAAGVSFFVDVAELWESYLLKLLQNYLGKEYVVYSPNSTRGCYLLDNSIREIRPDILIEREGRVVMIIDAKYKNYKTFGINANEGVSHEDLYQMNTYLYHYGENGKRITGIFTSPVGSVSDVHVYSSTPKHRVGLVNLDISSNDITTLHKEEERYVTMIHSILLDEE